MSPSPALAPGRDSSGRQRATHALYEPVGGKGGGVGVGWREGNRGLRGLDKAGKAMKTLVKALHHRIEPKMLSLFAFSA